MSPEQIKRWKKSRGAGRRSFILRTGVLGLGIRLPLVATLVTGLVTRPFYLPVLVIEFCAMAAIATPLGVMFAKRLWERTEAEYEKEMQSERHLKS